MPRIKLRRKQAEVLEYTGGRLGISAVPGSGKTTTLSALATKLIRKGLPPRSRVLVVTYQNSGVDNVNARIRGMLEAEGLLPTGFDVRTLHSLSHSIIRENPGLIGIDRTFEVLDQRTTNRLLENAIRIWNQQYPERRQAFIPDDRKFWEDVWMRVARKIGRQTVTLAKNYRLSPQKLWMMIEAEPEKHAGGLHVIGAEIYQLYQQQVQTLGALDYDDLVRLSVDLLYDHPDLARRFRERWPYVLEDEAQDSVPLQEELLHLITGPNGNWVRVGDPNQAIMSTFTASNPRYLNQFLDRSDVQVHTLDEAGRSSQRIIDLANYLVDWIADKHPLTEVREGAFRVQHIKPTRPDDPQQNPMNNRSKIEFRGHANREGQYRDIVRRAIRYCKAYPRMTFGILVTTNEIGYQLARLLEGERAPYEEMLSSSVNSRQVAQILLDILSFLSNPLNKQHLSDVYGRLREFGVSAFQNDHAEIIERWFRRHNTEVALYSSIHPSGIDPLEEIDESIRITIENFTGMMRRWMRAAALPVDQLILTIAGDLFTEARMATAQRIAATMRTWVDVNPEWRLPELVRELDQGIKSRMLRLEDEATVFEPTPGVITLTTMHRAKGLEWDFVFLVDTDVERFHYHAEEAFKGEYAFLGGNPEAEVKAAIQAIAGDPQYSGKNPTEAARIETIAEDCRLLYVGITRARRYLALSWGQEVFRYGKTNLVEPAIAFNRLRAYERGRDH